MLDLQSDRSKMFFESNQSHKKQNKSQSLSGEFGLF